MGVAGAVLPWILGGPNLYWGYENSHLLAGAAILAATIAIAATNERISRLGARVAIGGIGAFFLWQVTTVLSDTGHHDIHVGPGMLVSAIAGVSLIGSAVIGHGERVTHEAPLVSADA